MMDLVEGKKNMVGYVLGHKEPPIGENEPDLSPENVNREREHEVSAR